MTTSPTHEDFDLLAKGQRRCVRCKRAVSMDHTEVRQGTTSAPGYSCTNEAECLAAARTYLRSTIVDAVKSTLDLFVWPHNRVRTSTHQCPTTGAHTIHVCDCGWIWTSEAMTHTVPPPLPTMPPEPPGPMDWPTATFELDTLAGVPRVRWSDDEGVRHESVAREGPGTANVTPGETHEHVPVMPTVDEAKASAIKFDVSPPPHMVAVEDTSPAPVSGAPLDAKARLVAILARLHDLSAEMASIVEAAEPAPYGAAPWDLAAAAEMSRGVDVRLVLARLRRRRIAGDTSIPQDHPWCRICGNYCAAPGAVQGEPPRCSDRTACTARLVGDSHVLAGIPGPTGPRSSVEGTP